MSPKLVGISDSDREVNHLTTMSVITLFLLLRGKNWEIDSFKMSLNIVATSEIHVVGQRICIFSMSSNFVAKISYMVDFIHP